MICHTLRSYGSGIHRRRPHTGASGQDCIHICGAWQKVSATYCLAIEVIQSRYGAEMSAVPNRRICSTVDSSIFTPNLSRTAFFSGNHALVYTKFFCPAPAFLCFLIVDIQNVHGSVSDICKEISSLEISKVGLQ